MNKNHYKIILLSSLGGALEFFDFTIYALFAPYIAQVFFPVHNQTLSLIETFSVFTIGYLARPIGGLLMGRLGDKKGRRFSFTLSLFLMALSTLLIGLLPGYKTIGLLSPMLLVMFRLLQGFSVGGEIPSATIFTLEHLPYNRRGFAIGTIFMCITFGNALASIMGYGLTNSLSHSYMLAWGWRVPFIVGFFLSIISYILRKNTLETPTFNALIEKKKLLIAPITQLIRTDKKTLLMSFLLTALSAATVFIFLYLPTYLSTVLNYHISRSYLISTISFITLAIASPVFGLLSDRIGRKKVLVAGSLASIVIGYILFKMLTLHAIAMPWVFGIGLGLLVGTVNGSYAATIAEQFTPAIRNSGMGLSYNLGFALFGSLAPLLLTYFIKLSGNNMMPYYYFLICGLLTFIASVFFKVNEIN